MSQAPKVVLDAEAIDKAIAAMAERLASHKEDGPFAVIGVLRGGEPLSKRLAALLSARTQRPVPVGTVDITLYRDDGFGPHDWPEVGVTRLDFDLPSHTVILADDVLYTGRTVRAALDAVLDYGRPKAVRLAVLVDRGRRELPIGADAAGLTLDTGARDYVQVRWREQGAEADAVVVGERPNERSADKGDKSDKSTEVKR